MRTHELRSLMVTYTNGWDESDPLTRRRGQGEVITLDGVSRVDGLSILPGKKGLPSPRLETWWISDPGG